MACPALAAVPIHRDALGRTARALAFADLDLEIHWRGRRIALAGAATPGTRLGGRLIAPGFRFDVRGWLRALLGR